MHLSRRLPTILLVVLAWLTLGSHHAADGARAVLAQSAASPSENLELVEQFWGTTRVVAVQGNYAYIGVGSRLVVLDISDRAHPLPVGQSAPLPLVVRDIEVVGEYAYVMASHPAADTTVLHIFNITDPAAPLLVGSYEGRGWGQSMDIGGDYLYLADSNAVVIINVSNPAQPVEASRYHQSQGYFIQDVDLDGPYAYVAHNSGLDIVDISDPANPKRAPYGYYYPHLYPPHLIDGFFSVAVSGDYIYLARGSDLYILAWDRPQQRLRVVSRVQGMPAHTVSVAGDYAYVSGMFNESLEILDVSDKENPARVGYHPLAGNPDEITVVGDSVYVASGKLQILDVSDPAEPRLEGEYGSPSIAGITLEGDLAYARTYDDEVRVLDISDPAAPSQIAAFDAPGIRELEVAGSIGYLGTEEGLRILDLSNPATPVQLGAYPTSYPITNITLVGENAYITEGGQLRIIDVSDSSSPREVGSHSTGGEAREIAVAGELVYVVSNRARDRQQEGVLFIISLADPSNPTLVAQEIFSPLLFSVAVAGNYAYVSTSYGLQVLEVSNPAAPTRVDAAPMYLNSTGIVFVGNYAYASAGFGIQVLELCSPTLFSTVASYETPEPTGIALAGNHIFAPMGEAGIAVLRLSQPAASNCTDLYLPLLHRQGT